MVKSICKKTKCRRSKNLDNDGFCPTHKPKDSLDQIIEDNIICKCCTNTVSDNDDAIECDKCETWHHLTCTKVKQELYDQLFTTGNEDNGIKWYCEDCLSTLDKFLKTKVTKYSDTQIEEKMILPENIRIPICEEYKHGSCIHGITGRKPVDGKRCLFRHPKKCLKYCKYGNDLEMGCTGNIPNCRFLHPIICRNSIRYGACKFEKCTYSHLIGTQRRSIRPYHGNPNSFKQVGSKLPNSYSYNRPNYNSLPTTNSGSEYRYDQEYSFRHDQNKRPSTKTSKYKASEDNEFFYDDNDFPDLSNNRHPNNNAPNTNELRRNLNLHSDQHFLELLQAVQSIQSNQQSFQQELLSMRKMLPLAQPHPFLNTPMNQPQGSYPHYIPQSQQNMVIENPS